MTAPEQRKSKRFEMRLPVQVVREGARPLNGHGETRNLSSVGVLFTSDVELEIGSPIEYFITLEQGLNGKDTIRLHCMGKVVRRQVPGEGADEEAGIAMAATLERYEFVRPEN